MTVMMLQVERNFRDNVVTRKKVTFIDLATAPVRCGFVSSVACATLDTICAWLRSRNAVIQFRLGRIFYTRFRFKTHFRRTVSIRVLKYDGNQVRDCYAFVICNLMVLFPFCNKIRITHIVVEGIVAS